MPRIRIEDIRRQELTEAAWSVLQAHGFGGTTLQRVATAAGVSKGMVLHYFRDKDTLIEQAMRYENALLRDEVIRRMRLAGDPYGRLLAIVEGNFDPAHFQPAICLAWLSLCAEVPHKRQFQRVQRAIHARMHSNLLSALRPLLPAAAAERTARSLSALIDGLWLRAGLGTVELSASQALAEVMLLVELAVPRPAAARSPAMS